mmetsp:Transcript_104619/g.207766  ORF Transcript_104619/g.207766 Transcript_104619/m.207766 type:complete len:219 (-) Transcript_104619:242-898(-)
MEIFLWSEGGPLSSYSSPIIVGLSGKRVPPKTGFNFTMLLCGSGATMEPHALISILLRHSPIILTALKRNVSSGLWKDALDTAKFKAKEMPYRHLKLTSSLTTSSRDRFSKRSAMRSRSNFHEKRKRLPNVSTTFPSLEAYEASVCRILVSDRSSLWSVKLAPPPNLRDRANIANRAASLRLAMGCNQTSPGLNLACASWQTFQNPPSAATSSRNVLK